MQKDPGIQKKRKVNLNKYRLQRDQRRRKVNLNKCKEDLQTFFKNIYTEDKILCSYSFKPKWSSQVHIKYERLVAYEKTV